MESKITSEEAQITPIPKSNNRKKEAWEKWITWLEIIALIIFILLTILFFCKGLLNLGDTALGTYGDLIGGIVGTFVAYLSVRLLVSTLKKQIDANTENSKLNSQTAEVYKIQQFNEQFKILFDLYQNILKQYTNEQNKITDLSVLVRDYFSTSNIVDGEDYDLRRKKAIESFQSFYVSHLAVASVHFRLLYRIFQLIDDANIPQRNKTSIIKIIRCQLSPDELFLLRYNAMTDNGSKMRQYINSFNLLKHLPILSLMEFSNIKSKLDGNQQNSVNSESVIWKKKIKNMLLFKSSVNQFETSYNERYKLKISVSDSKDKCEIKISKHMKVRSTSSSFTNFSSALDQMSDKDIENFLRDFAEELFLSSNFSLYNTNESIKIIPEITDQKESKVKVFSVEIRKNDHTPLICSQQQLNEPISKE